MAYNKPGFSEKAGLQGISLSIIDSQTGTRKLIGASTTLIALLPAGLCQQTVQVGFNALHKHWALDAYRVDCREGVGAK